METFVVFLLAITLAIVVVPYLMVRIHITLGSRILAFISSCYDEVVSSVIIWLKVVNYYYGDTDEKVEKWCCKYYRGDFDYSHKINYSSKFSKKFYNGTRSEFIVRIFGEKYARLFDSNSRWQPNDLLLVISLYNKLNNSMNGKNDILNNSIITGRELLFLELENRHSILSNPAGGFERIMKDTDMWKDVDMLEE